LLKKKNETIESQSSKLKDYASRAAADFKTPESSEPRRYRFFGSPSKRFSNFKPNNFSDLFYLRRETLRRWKKAVRTTVCRKISSTRHFATVIKSLHKDLAPTLDELRDTIAALRPSDVSKVVPLNFVTELVRAGQQEFADAMQGHFSAALAVNIKYTNIMSWVKYFRMRALLSSVFEPRTGQWERKSFNGVMYPMLPGRHKMGAVVAELKRKFSLKVSHSGLSASADLRFLAARAILTSVDKGFYVIENSQVLRANGDPVNAHFLMDAANHHEG
jgi:hypothetical protein